MEVNSPEESNRFFKHRRNPLKEVSDAEMETTLQFIADNFRVNWLTASGYHPLQRLWQRRDTLSTIELFTFGSNLMKLNTRHGKWVQHQVGQIKTNQVNNFRGSFFEVNALASLLGDHQNIRPTKKNAPGVDGVLSFPDGKEMSISLKNYGMSSSYKDFIAECEKVNGKVKAELNRLKMPRIQFLINVFRDYPLPKDWKELNAAIPAIIDGFRTGHRQLTFGIWHVHTGDILDPNGQYHLDHSTYTLIIGCPYHTNEEKNLIEKLDSACANLAKHSTIQNANLINSAFIKLPLTASMIKCEDWARNYFETYPHKPISCIMLYQVSFATDPNNGLQFVHHCFRMVTKNSTFRPWNTPPRSVVFDIPVGISDGKPSQDLFIADIEGEKHFIEVQSRYHFQRGEHYLAQQRDSYGNLSVHLNDQTPGIKTYGVMQPFPDQPSFAFTPIAPPDTELLIL